MKKIFALGTIIAMLLSLHLTVVAAAPVAISNESELKAMTEKGNYYLANDIILSENFTPLKTFSGELDGRNKKIVNLTVSRNGEINSTVYAGLFERLDGTVKNLTLENAKISVTGGKNVYAGAICGRVDVGTVLNCRVSGEIEVSASNSNVFAGGIVGQNNAEINHCENRAKITVNASRAVVGGIVGEHARSDYALEKCINFAQLTVKGVSDINYAGGVVGKTVFTTENCANYGKVTLDSARDGYVGGIAATVTNGEIKNCFSGGTLNCNAKTESYTDPIVAQHNNKCSQNYYFDKVISGLNTADVKTASALDERTVSSASVFAGFDFANVWEMGENGPVLKCITAASIEPPKQNSQSPEDTSSVSSALSSSSQGVSSAQSEISNLSGGAVSSTGTVSNDEKDPYPEETARHNSPPILIFIVISAVTLTGAGVFIFFYLQNKKR